MKELKENSGVSNKCNSSFPYKNGEETLDYDTYMGLELQEQFNCFFPTLT
jgi:hypothetical protein